MTLFVISRKRFEEKTFMRKEAKQIRQMARKLYSRFKYASRISIRDIMRARVNILSTFYQNNLPMETKNTRPRHLFESLRFYPRHPVDRVENSDTHTRARSFVRAALSLAVCNLLTTHLLCIATLFAATPCSAFLYAAL